MQKKTSFLVSLFILLNFAAFAFATTTNYNSASCAGQWTSCTSANYNGGFSAAAPLTSSLNKTTRWQSYALSFSNGSIITNVIMRADFWVNNATASTQGFLNVRVSPNAGVTYGPNHDIQGTTAQQNYYINVTDDFAWTPSMLTYGNFKVNSTCYKNGTALNLTCRLDWIPVNVTYIPFAITLSLNPNNRSVNADLGESAVANVTVALNSGITQRITLSASGCPPTSTCTFGESVVYPTVTTNLTVTPSSSTPAGTYNVTIYASGGSLFKSKVFVITVASSCVTGAPTLVAVPESQSGNPGDTLNYSIDVTNNDAAACGAANFTMSATYKSGFNTSYDNSILLVTAGETGATTLRITSASNSSVLPGTYTFSSVATSQKTGLDGDDNVTYTIPFDFALSIDPVSRNVDADVSQSALANVTVTLTEGGTHRVNLTVAGCPPFSFVCNMTNAFLYPTATTLLNVTPSPKTPAGVYTINVTAKGPGHTYLEQFTVYVASSCVYRAPQVSIAPDNLSGPLNTTLAFVTTVTNIDNASCTAGNFSMSVVNPAGYNSSFSPAGFVIGPGNSSQMNFNITATTVLSPGDRTFTHTATRTNGLQGSDDAIVTYQPFDFSIELAPTEQTVNLSAGGFINATSNVSLTTLVSPTQRVNMSTTGCPPLANCSFRHPTFGYVLNYASPYATLTFVANLTATPPGNYLINITSAGDANTEVAVFNVTVV